ncbi:MAG: TetR/AcrR family transcriptional regulator [Asticcacaulis sp.]|uniref:TetR/AcrR family transcriptional regulator n=1 Tax=Asticcacaulis sp. TaxID=1872648 RepID=UPI0039E43980
MRTSLPETRSYISPKREAAAAAKRQAVIAAADRLLSSGPAMMSMEAVARAAGVTRLTVYKQFGSRRGLLEAVFDANAERGGATRLRELAQLPDPREALFACIDLLCTFWGSHPGFTKLNEAAFIDPEFAEAIRERNARRHQLFTRLLARMAGDEQARQDAADLIFSLVSVPTFRILIADRQSSDVATLLKSAAAAILDAHKLG